MVSKTMRIQQFHAAQSSQSEAATAKAAAKGATD
jgi:hypothetical protein